MDSVIPATADALRTLAGRISVLENRVGELIKTREAPEDFELADGGMAALTALASQIEIAMAEVTASLGGGNFLAKRLQYTGSTVAVDDQDGTAGLILAGPGASPFVGCRGLVVLVGTSPITGIWWMVSGECNGFWARVTGVPVNFRYPWVQINPTVGLAALTSAQLDDALDKASVGIETAILASDRYVVPVSTPVFIQWDGTNFVFTLGPEPKYELC